MKHRMPFLSFAKCRAQLKYESASIHNVRGRRVVIGSSVKYIYILRAGRYGVHQAGHERRFCGGFSRGSQSKKGSLLWLSWRAVDFDSLKTSWRFGFHGL